MKCKRIAAALLCAMILGSSISIPASANEMNPDHEAVSLVDVGDISTYSHLNETSELAASGYNSGESVQWELYENGTLYIYGSGEFTPGDYMNQDVPVIRVVIEDGVTNIPNGAFHDCLSLVDVKIGKDVETIDNIAFYHCENLKTVTIPSNVAAINDAAFAFCSKLTNIKLFNPGIDLFPTAFGDCGNLKTVSLYGGFEQWSDLDLDATFESAYADEPINFRFPETHDCDEAEVVSRGQCGDNVFWVLTENSTLYIYGQGAMYDYEGDAPWGTADTIIVEDGVTHIGAHAFEHTEYHFADISETVKTSGEFALGIGLSEKGLYYGGTRDQFVDMCMFDEFDLRHMIELVKQTSDDEEGNQEAQARLAECYSQVNSALDNMDIMYGNCVSLGNFIKGGQLGDSVYWALYDDGTAYVYGSGNMAENYYGGNLPFENFSEYSGYNPDDAPAKEAGRIDKIVVEDGVTNIGNYVFSNCITVSDVSVAGSVESIGEQAFCGCFYLETLTLEQGVRSINKEAFFGCDSLRKINIPASLQNIDPTAFSYCNKIQEITVDDNNPTYTSVENVLFTKDLSKLIKYPAGAKNTIYSVPSGVEIIGDSSFDSCCNLEEVTFPNSVKTIENNAFCDSSSIKRLILPDSVSYIGDEAFSTCTRLAELRLPANLTYFGSKAVFCCIDLKSITIPKCVTKLTSTDLAGCSSLESISVESGNPNFISVDGVLFNKSKTTLIKYPAKKKLDTYNIPSGTATIMLEAFDSTSYLHTLNIPESVSTIDSLALNLNRSIAAFNVDPDNWAFSSLDGVLYNKARTTLLVYPYNKECDVFNIPSGVEKIEKYSFESTNITNVFIPSTVESIGYRAFSFCTELKTVAIEYGKLTKLPENVFTACYSFESIIIPKSIRSIEKNAFETVNDIYYTGTQSQWNRIAIDPNDKGMANASIYFNTLANHSHISAEKVNLGEIIEIKGSAEGGTGNLKYSYYYKKSSANKWTAKLENTYGTYTSFKPGAAVPYDIKVVVTDQNGNSVEKIFTCSVEKALRNTSTVPETILLGESIVINGAAENGTAPYKYSYYYRRSGATKWNAKLENTTAASTSFKPGVDEPYEIKVVVTDAEGNTAEKIFECSVEKPFENTSTVPEKITLGDTIKIKGSAKGGRSSYSYGYYYKKSSANTWTTKSEYTNATSTSFKPGAAVPYDIKVVAYDSNGKEAEKIFTCAVEKPLENKSTVPESIKLGEYIKITGAAENGTGPYKYSYYYKKSTVNTWNKRLENTTATSTSFKPGSAVAYDIKVVVTDSTGKTAEKVYTCSVKNPLENTSVVPESIKLGEKVTINGSAKGGTAPYTFSYYYKKSSVNNWNTKFENTTTTSTSFKPGSAVLYDVRVVVTDANGEKAENIYTVSVNK